MTRNMCYTEPDVMMKEPTKASQDEIETIIQYHIWISIGAGLVPFPVIDLVALAGIQVNMIRELANVYQVPFVKEIALNLLTSVVGKTVLVTAGPKILLSMAKLIPGIGQAAGMLSLPVLAGASTYATGKVFNRHFSSGGTLHTFRPNTLKDYYHTMFKEGRQVVAAMHIKARGSNTSDSRNIRGD